MKDLDAVRREVQSSFPIDNLLIPLVSKGLQDAVLGLEGWASIYDNSLDSMFTNAGEAIPARC